MICLGFCQGKAQGFFIIKVRLQQHHSQEGGTVQPSWSVPQSLGLVCSTQLEGWADLIFYK